jgi:hypothetical protein
VLSFNRPDTHSFETLYPKNKDTRLESTNLRGTHKTSHQSTHI